jgi:NAD(P)H-nitrite reductase large subunit
MHHQVFIHDGILAADNLGGETRDYKVLRPLFKNSKEYQPGDTITLARATGEAFLRTGDIEEMT